MPRRFPTGSTRRGRWLLGAISLVVCAAAWFPAAGAEPTRAVPPVGPVPPAMRSTWKLSDFYEKAIDLDGLPIVGSKNVSDAAVAEAAWIVRHMFEHRPDLPRVMGKNQVRLVVMAWNEFTTDVPEHSRLSPKVYWDRRARGLGGTPRDPTVSCAEENLLGFPGDPYATENILIHEFAHSIHLNGLRTTNPDFNKRLRDAYDSAKQKGLWAKTYAITNPSEYWAEAVQSWFDTNRHDDALHNHVDTRDELKAYDPAVAQLCLEVFGDLPWRYRRPRDRTPDQREHLQGFDASKAPRFRWREAPVPDKPLVLIQTAMGDIEVELAAKQAPRSVENFLRLVHLGAYSDGVFFRTVTATNQPDSPIKIAVVQARAADLRATDRPPPIPLERTSSTGLKHLDGTISMARDGPDTAQDQFFFCIGDQPELDSGGQRNPDGQGFAAFGKVTKGTAVLRAIHASPAEGQTLTPPIAIQRAVRLN